MSTDVVGQENPPSTAPARRAGMSAWEATKRFRMVIGLVALLFVFFAVTQGDFLTAQNLQNMLTAVAVLWVISMGMTFVQLTGGVDLSVGAIAGLCGVVLAKLIGLGIPGGFSLLLTIVVGTLLGAALNGFFVGKLNLSFFVVTLASMTTLTGFVNLWTSAESYIVTAPIVNQIAIDSIFGLAAPIWIMVAIFLVALYVQSRTFFGRDVYATGGSLIAARLAGIRTSRTLILVYAISGACAALAGAMIVGRVGAATPATDNTLALQAVAAVLLGGTSIFGGQGGVGGTVFGVLFIGILQNGLSIAGVSSYWQAIVTGIILVAAVGGQSVGSGGLSFRWLFGGGRGGPAGQRTDSAGASAA
jgi:ribose/xylose/arabinose/galactoside ABC-type transport system permease subunit